MCGIAGVVDVDVDRAQRRVEALNRLQEHRGPDQAVVVRCGGFTIGNTRLAIQDPSPAGNQPLVGADGRFVAVFNGEIYNHTELRRDHGLDLPGSTDGAVIPALWERMGPRCLALLRGMWAVAVVDTHQKTLTLARDPFGIKPLFLRHLPDGSLAFASELTALCALAERPSLNKESIAEFLHLGALGRTASPFTGTSLLPPNSWARYGPPGTGPEPSCTGAVLEGPSPFTTGVGGADLREALDESVALHVRSDVPTALLLSGGVDSALLANAAARRGQRLRCFTVRVKGATDESREAAATAAAYGHDHEIVDAGLTPDDADRFLQAMQRPTIDGLNTFVVSRAIHERGYRVALSGLGGDEAIAGYPHMRYFLLARGLSLLGTMNAGRLARRAGAREKVAQLLETRGNCDALGYDELFRRLTPRQEVARMTGTTSTEMASAVRGRAGTRDLIEVEVEHYLQRTLLPDTDAFSMRWSVEMRVPFVDVPFFKTASKAALPLLGKARIVRRMGDRHLQQVLRRPKRGFSLPMAGWLDRGPLSPLLDEAMTPEASVWDWIDRDVWTESVASQPAGRWAPTWALAVLNAWLAVSSRREIACD